MRYLAMMFRFDKITITQFKNYGLASFDFRERVTGICGLNGKGKTNLLDAIYYLCFTKSYFTRTDSFNVQFGAEGCRLEGIADLDGHAHRIVSINRGGGRKELLLNDIPYDKFSLHIGKFPCVMIAPDDIELVTGGSEERRKFMDTVLSQLDADYLQQLILYNKVMQQRNSLLKRFAEQGQTDWQLLEVMDEQLAAPGTLIHQQRKIFTTELIPLAQAYYRQIAGNEETVTLVYESQLNQTDMHSLLNNHRQRDFALQRTTAGIHKDDILFELDEHNFKNTASQGQRKSLLFAMKLSEFSLLKKGKGFEPILLLDDVFEKLDDTRMNNLLHYVCSENAGQVFITDTHRNRLEDALKGLEVGFEIIELV